MMSSNRVRRWGGAAGVAGGIAWVVATAIHASKPVGCVGAECARTAMREAGVVEGALTGSALLLFALGGLALVVLARRANRFGSVGRAGIALVTAGGSVLIAAGAAQALFFDGDFHWMPYFVGPGITAIVLGFVLLAAMVLRAGVLPRWAGVSLVVGALALLLSNEQTATAWFAVLLGLAWIAVGVALWRRPTGSTG